MYHDYLRQSDSLYLQFATFPVSKNMHDMCELFTREKWIRISLYKCVSSFDSEVQYVFLTIFVFYLGRERKYWCGRIRWTTRNPCEFILSSYVSLLFFVYMFHLSFSSLGLVNFSRFENIVHSV